MAPVRLDLAVGSCSVGALPLAQEHAGSRIEAFSEGLEVFLSNVALESEQFCPTPAPPARYPLTFCIVVAMFQMPGRIPFSVRHGPNREHAASPAYRKAQ